ncbi:MAG TPA: iron-sulfur cluster assembly protein [Solirubrobacteraceae bacterium]
MSPQTRERVLGELGMVYDPELDEPITDLRFVSSCEVTADGDVEVRLRLPTPQCAPNFAFLMAADARAAAHRVPGVRAVTVVLEDHYTGDEINQAMARGEGFVGAFPGETDDDELAALRGRFQRKALVARQAEVCEALLETGVAPEELTALRVAEVPAGPAFSRCLELRRELCIAADPAAPAFVRADGGSLDASELPRWLRMARLIRTSLEANGGICRALLAARLGLPDREKEIAT